MTKKLLTRLKILISGTHKKINEGNMNETVIDKSDIPAIAHGFVKCADGDWYALSKFVRIYVERLWDNENDEDWYSVTGELEDGVGIALTGCFDSLEDANAAMDKMMLENAG